MSSEEILSSENINGPEEVTPPASSENVPFDNSEESIEILEEDMETSEESMEISEEDTETSEESMEISEEDMETSEENTETSTEVIYQVTDLTRVENSLDIIICFIIFFAVFFLGSMVYKLVKDIF